MVSEDRPFWVARAGGAHGPEYLTGNALRALREGCQAAGMH